MCETLRQLSLFRGLVLVLYGRRNFDLRFAKIDTVESITVGWRGQFALDGLGRVPNFDEHCSLDLRVD